MENSPSKPANPQPALPALKSLGELADLQPCIVIDTREQAPLVFTGLPSITSALQTGDYSFAGGEELFSIERKSIPDLVACCTGDNRERFERELHRLRGFKFARLLIVGYRLEVEQHRYRSNLKPKAVLSTLAAFEARYIPVVWSETPEQAAQLIERWEWWFCRELVKQANGLLACKTVSETKQAFLNLHLDNQNALVTASRAPGEHPGRFSRRTPTKGIYSPRHANQVTTDAVIFE